MKIKSLLIFNTALLANHAMNNSDKVVIGSAQPDYLNIPAGSTIELEDSEWVKFADAAAEMIEGKQLVMVEAPALSQEEKDAIAAEELAKAEALIKASKPVSKSKEKKED